MKDRFSLSFKAFYLIYLGAIGSFIPKLRPGRAADGL